MSHYISNEKVAQEVQAGLVKTPFEVDSWMNHHQKQFQTQVPLRVWVSINNGVTKTHENL